MAVTEGDRSADLQRISPVLIASSLSSVKRPRLLSSPPSSDCNDEPRSKRHAADASFRPPSTPNHDPLATITPSFQSSPQANNSAPSSTESSSGNNDPVRPIVSSDGGVLPAAVAGTTEQPSNATVQANVRAKKKYRNAPPLVPLDAIPDIQRRIVVDTTSKFRISQPRDFQVVSINHASFNDDTLLCIIRRTADGKSLIPLTVARIRRGVAIVQVPLHGLGSDQVKKANVPEHGVEAYYVNEHKLDDGKQLRDRLAGLSEDEAQNCTIILYMSPKSLSEESKWHKTISSLAKQGFISLLCIDEAHSVEQYGRCFRPEFITSTKYMRTLLDAMPHPVPRIVMSATFREKDRNRVTDLLGDMKPNIMQGSLARRGTMFQCKVSGDANVTFKDDSKRDLSENPDAQILWYCNSKHKAEGPLLDVAQAMLDEHFKTHGGEKTTCQSFTGGDGVMMKAATMDAFTAYSSIDSSQGLLPKIQILTATSAANCGISSDDLDNARHHGLPASLYELVQEMGRVNRRLDAVPGKCHYEVHISFDSIISLYIRIMSNEDKRERKRLLAAMMEVLQMLVTPDKCYHSAIELYFEVDPCGEKVGCGQFCSYCKDDHKSFTKTVSRRGLVSVLSTKVNSGMKKLTPKGLVKVLSANRDIIFPRAHRPKGKKMGPYHGLAMQLLARGIIAMEVDDKTKVGTKKITQKDLFISLPNGTDSDGLTLPAYWIPSYYDCMQTVE